MIVACCLLCAVDCYVLLAVVDCGWCLLYMCHCMQCSIIVWCLLFIVEVWCSVCVVRCSSALFVVCCMESVVCCLLVGCLMVVGNCTKLGLFRCFLFVAIAY